MTDGNIDNIVKLYRAVGFSEYVSLVDGELFQILRGGVAVKYFGRNFEETLNFANMPINNGVVAVFEVGLPRNVLMIVGNFVNVDKFIFRSGTVEIPEEHLREFNNAVCYVKHIY